MPRSQPAGVALAALAVAVALSALALGAQGTAPSIAGPDAIGSGLIMGRVTEVMTDTPVAGVIVSANATVTRALGDYSLPKLFRTQTVVTGPDGVFVFRDLPVASFTIRARISGFVALAPMQTVKLAANELVNDIEFRLAKAGAISGEVRDEAGEGVEGITVSLFNNSGGAVRRVATVQQTMTTDDRGWYRFPGLLPGSYSVCALFSRRVAPIAISVAQNTGSRDLDQTMAGSSARPATGSGYRVGDLMLISSSAGRNVDPGPDAGGRLLVFADACDAGATTVQTAVPIRVDSGEEPQINLLLRLVPGVRVTGTVTGTPNRRAGLAVNLRATSADPLSVVGAPPIAQTVTDLDGNFGFLGVASGSYLVTTTYVAQLAGEPTLWATASTTVGDTDVSDVSLALREGLRVSGQLVFDGTTAPPTREQLVANPVVFEATGTTAGTTAPFPATTSVDLKVTMAGVPPGQYLVRLAGPFERWALKSIVANGRDVSDQPLEISADVSGMIVTLTDRPPQLSGTVRDASGQPPRHASVVVFPSDRTTWNRLGGRRSLVLPVSRQGTFATTSLPAGDYSIVAVTDRITIDWQDVKLVESLAQAATHVTLRDANSATVTLSVAIR